MIGGDKIGEGSYGCIYHPALNKDGSESENKKFVSKIQKDNKYANNEIKIGELVSKIDGYINHFAPILMKEKMKITKVKKNFFVITLFQMCLSSQIKKNAGTYGKLFINIVKESN